MVALFNEHRSEERTRSNAFRDRPSAGTAELCDCPTYADAFACSCLYHEKKL